MKLGKGELAWLQSCFLSLRPCAVSGDRLRCLPDAVGSCHHPVGCDEGSSTGVLPFAVCVVLKGDLESTERVRLWFLLADFSLLLFLPAPRTQLSAGRWGEDLSNKFPTPGHRKVFPSSLTSKSLIFFLMLFLPKLSLSLAQTEHFICFRKVFFNTMYSCAPVGIERSTGFHTHLD